MTGFPFKISKIINSIYKIVKSNKSTMILYPPRQLQHQSVAKRIMSRRKKRRQCLSVKVKKIVRKTRMCNPILDVDDDGIRTNLIPEKTYWYRNYVSFPHLDSPKFLAKFRRRFRLPYHCFLSLLELVKNDPTFERWDVNRFIRSRVKRHPIELLLLGSLHYLGRGWTFDDLEECTGISEETHRVFFHAFVKFGRDVLYRKYVKYPKTSEDDNAHSKEYDLAGMHGAIGSMDACHIILEKCSHRLRQNHLGGKSKQTCRSYNITVNHKRQILASTTGHPARWNDKTIILYDELARGLKNGSILNDKSFELYERSSNGNIIAVKYRGAWLLVDNGYLNWGVTIAPMKQTVYVTETRWSEWLESMRKDVECTFGILKGRFRILKAGVRCHGVDIADNIWIKCCALHNMLLDFDGLTVDWIGDEGLFDFDENSDVLPFALQRLVNPSERRNYDSSGMGVGPCDDVENSEDTHPHVNGMQTNEVTIDRINEVKNLTADAFRKKLVEHFDILFKQHRIQWTRRLKSNSVPANI